MKRSQKNFFMLLIPGVILLGLALRQALTGEASRQAAAPARFKGETVIIDAGHGGEDGGAVSPSGVVESNVNLDIALRLEQLFGLYGVKVRMLRNTDVSLHSKEAKTLRQKKVSDLHNRVAMIEETPEATLISIHQNSYPSQKYRGAQVFFAPTDGSRELAVIVQETLRTALDENNHRQSAKIPKTVYLMNHVTCRAILIECGFLTNYEEERLLVSSMYQTKLAAALCGAYLQVDREVEDVA